MTAIGALRIRLTIEAPVAAADGAGGVARSWSALADVWAAVEPLGAAAAVEADRTTGLYKYRVTIRRRADVSEENRFRLGNRILAIRALRDPDERGEFLECFVEEERP